jgi:hypothetical protein
MNRQKIQILIILFCAVVVLAPSFAVAQEKKAGWSFWGTVGQTGQNKTGPGVSAITASAMMKAFRERVEALRKERAAAISLQIKGMNERQLAARAAQRQIQNQYVIEAEQRVAAIKLQQQQKAQAAGASFLPPAAVAAPPGAIGWNPAASAPAVSAAAGTNVPPIKPYIPKTAPVQQWQKQQDQQKEAEKWRAIRVTPSSVLAKPAPGPGADGAP